MKSSYQPILGAHTLWNPLVQELGDFTSISNNAFVTNSLDFRTLQKTVIHLEEFLIEFAMGFDHPESIIRLSQTMSSKYDYFKACDLVGPLGNVFLGEAPSKS